MWIKYLFIVLCSVSSLHGSGESEVHCDVREETPSSGTGEERPLCEDKQSFSFLFRTEWQRGILAHIEDSTCRSQLQQALKDLRSMDLWAFKMLDSSGRIPSRLLSGNSHQLGDYDQCLGISHAHIRPQYCLALIDVTAAPSAPDHIKHLVKRVRGNDFIRSHRTQTGHFIPTYTTIKWGLCVPNSCSPSSLSKSLNAFFNLTLPAYLTVQTSIEQRYCKQGPLQNEPEKWPLSTYLGLLLFASLLMTSLVSTYFDQDQVPLNKLSKIRGLQVFCSIKRNWAQFFLLKNEDIGCIHGLRTIATVLLFIAHNTIPVASIPFINRTGFTDITFAAYSSIFRSSIVYTDTFLFLSGLLSSYYLQNTSSILGRVGNRVLRMLPALLAVIVFSGYILPHLSSGPLWSYIVETNAQLCVRNGWRNLLFIQNLFPFEEMCAPHTHQLALDIHLFVLTIPLVLGLKTHPKLTSICILLLNLCSAVLRYATVKANRLSVVIYTGVTLQDLYRIADLSYILPLHRASAYLSGLWLGFLLYKTKSYPIKLSKGILYLGWSVAGLCLAYCLMANFHAGDIDYQYDASESAQYAALEPVLTSVALSWIILVCSTGYGGSVNSFLSSRTMCLFSKMSFSIYLVQFCVFFYSLGTVRSSRTFSILYLVAWEEFLLVIIISFVVTLFIDLPVQNLKALIFR